MSADVYIVLGRINLKAVQERKRIGTVQSDTTALVLFEGLNVDADDFTLMNVPAEYDLNRNYSLFGWLSNVRGTTRPLVEKDDTIKTQTMEFIRWLDQKWIEKARKANPDKTGIAFYHFHEELEDKYDIGDHSRIIHTLNTLLAFDYDQVVEVTNYEAADFDWDNPVYIRDESGETYRERFGKPYFDLLDFCKREHWHFIIFGFDN